MQLSIIRGVFDRRILISYRLDPDAVAAILPAPFQPEIVHGFAIGSVCLIRLRQIRPRFMPAFLGLASENLAHRFAVEWESNGERHEGVYIPRRDTSSWLSSTVGGMLFPSEHHRARFDVCEGDGRHRIEVNSVDARIHVLVEARTTERMPASELFASLPEHSEFIQHGSLGYSATCRQGHFDGMQLRSFRWHAEPLEVTRLESSYFDDRARFPAGSVAYDSALLMRDIEHEWHAREPLCSRESAVMTR